MDHARRGAAAARLAAEAVAAHEQALIDEQPDSSFAAPVCWRNLGIARFFAGDTRRARLRLALAIDALDPICRAEAASTRQNLALIAIDSAVVEGDPIELDEARALLDHARCDARLVGRGALVGRVA